MRQSTKTALPAAPGDFGGMFISLHGVNPRKWVAGVKLLSVVGSAFEIAVAFILRP
jgi:hypothetical protein